MDKKFTSDEVPLSQVFGQAADGKLQLPDFQRGWVWDDVHIKSLLVSVSLTYPIGAVMTLQTGNPDVRFRPRPLEGAVLPQPKEPELLLLDGQQRITSLFLALKSPDPVPTRDSRGTPLQRHYDADINACISPVTDREDEGIRSVPADRLVTTDFGREVLLDVRTQEDEIAVDAGLQYRGIPVPPLRVGYEANGPHDARSGPGQGGRLEAGPDRATINTSSAATVDL